MLKRIKRISKRILKIFKCEQQDEINCCAYEDSIFICDDLCKTESLPIEVNLIQEEDENGK